MSLNDASRARQSALASLVAKRTGNPPSALPPALVSPERSPNHILVPSSSSPVVPTTSNYFKTSTGAIPSSNLNRSNGFPSNGTSSFNSSGSPGSVINAIHQRHNPVQQQHPPGQRGSLSYQTVSRPSLGSSPASPAHPNRLKPNYNDTPTKSSPSSTNPSQLSPQIPGLIQAAKEKYQSPKPQPYYSAPEESLISQLALRFRHLDRDIIVECVRRNRDQRLQAIREVETIATRKGIPEFVTFKPNGASTVGKIHPPPASRQPSNLGTSSSLPSSYPKPTPKPSKPKKNEKSRIYAHRTNDNGKHKRRERDGSESDAQISEAESEQVWSGDEGPQRKKRRGPSPTGDPETEALKAFNRQTSELLTGTIACSTAQAETIIRLRPYSNAEEVRTKLTKARGVSPKLFEQYVEIMEGYVQIDACLNRCASIAADVADALAVWRGASNTNDSVVGTPRSDGLNDVKVDVAKVSELLRKETNQRKRKILSSYIQQQPASLSKGTVLKDYQLLGLNWLNLLYSKKIGCILADEMGLGKTIQVIAFIAALKEKGVKGPHMIFVPASTLENWIREFERFAPGIDVQPYYGSQAERAGLRDDLKRQYRAGKLEVVLASYTQVAAPDDLAFFRKKVEFDMCVYDEGHKLKNCTTKAYNDLMSIQPRWRLLLTGTPLQNNLQELVSLLMFIHRDTFVDAEPYLRAIFKSQGQASLLSQQRTSRARTMLTPFVLRRRKAHVLTLPPKIETVEHCDMSPVQAKIYRETMKRSRKALEELDDDALEAAAADDEAEANKHHQVDSKKAKDAKEKQKSKESSSSNILMDLRKAASHPLLFRRLYTDAKIRQIAKACLGTPRWCDSNYDYVVEDLEIMSDAELHHFCTSSEYEELQRFALKTEVFLDGGKVAALQKHVERCKKEGKRMLLFSQFVMILDVLEVALEHLGVKYTRLDGSTKTDERQGLVDEFNDDPEITVFLLSTKAGGVGINLTAASVVIIYDQDFNPHNDRQAADRAYRIGQEKEVEVIKLITKDSIDEDMLLIGQTKLQLDDAVGGEELTIDPGANQDDKTAKEVRKSLLTTLRNKFEAVSGPTELGDVREETPIKDGFEVQDAEGTPTVKRARPSLPGSQGKKVV
ncbi:hypothetical protein M231_01379 [Tremella mesenterica]|uniref:ATP-dependent helicase fft2 n=1 Tax=Tremella mesenterica TaxID=5217 RepID=A0A4Q1BT47_TREME|nr:hypothetical protein M231_01379 [Tremella mesenterica]